MTKIFKAKVAHFVVKTVASNDRPTLVRFIYLNTTSSDSSSFCWVFKKVTGLEDDNLLTSYILACGVAHGKRGRCPQEPSDLLKRMWTRIIGSGGLKKIQDTVLSAFHYFGFHFPPFVWASEAERLWCACLCVLTGTWQERSHAATMITEQWRWAMLYYSSIQVWSSLCVCCGGWVFVFSIQVGFEHEFGCYLYLSLLPWVCFSLGRWWRLHQKPAGEMLWSHVI